MINSVNRILLYTLCVKVVFLHCGIAFSFGSFFVGLVDEYKSDRASTATVQSLLAGVTLSFGVVSGALITKLGLPLVTLLACLLVPAGFSVYFFATRIEHLYISIGMISGVGVSMGYVSTVVIACRIFTSKNRGLFLAILSASSSLAGLAYPYFIDWLIELYYINGAFLILGAIYSNTFPLFITCWMNRTSLTEVTLPSKKITTIETEKEKKVPYPTSRHKVNMILTGVHIFREMMNTTYCLLLFATATSVACINGYSGLILDICRWKGFSSSQGLFTFVIFNIANIVSRLLPGILKQLKGDKSFCPEFIPVASGLLFTMTGVLSAASGPIFGSLRDISGSYDTVFLTIGVIQVIAVIFFSIALIYRRIDVDKRKTQQRSDDTIFSITITQD